MVATGLPLNLPVKPKALLQQEHLKKAEKSTLKPRVANKTLLIPRANNPMQLTTLKRHVFENSGFSLVPRVIVSFYYPVGGI